MSLGDEALRGPRIAAPARLRKQSTAGCAWHRPSQAPEGAGQGDGVG